MKNRYKFLLLVLLLFLSACSSTPRYKPEQGATFPWTRFQLLNGDDLFSEQLHGKTTVITFWASWCNFSRPAVKRISRFIREQNHPDVRFLAVSLDKHEDYNKLSRMIEREDLNNQTHCFSGNEFADEAFLRSGGDRLPYFVILDKNLKLVTSTPREKEVYRTLERL